MKLREYITAERKPNGSREILSKAEMYLYQLEPYWREIQSDVIESHCDITVDASKEYSDKEIASR